MPKVDRYHPALAALHWLMAVLIVAALALGALVMAKLPNSSAMKLEALRSHMAGGALILTLMLLRLALRTRTSHPPVASAGHPALDRIAWASHRLFYVLVFAMAASGIVTALQAGLPAIVFAGQGALPPDLWVFPTRWAHYFVSRLLMALIALHVAAALYHAVILRDGLLRRMLFGHRSATGAASSSRVLPEVKS